jgi:hypothetical protein
MWCRMYHSFEDGLGGGDVSRASAHDDFVLQTSSNGISGNIEE